SSPVRQWPPSSRHHRFVFNVKNAMPAIREVLEFEAAQLKKLIPAVASLAIPVNAAIIFAHVQMRNGRAGLERRVCGFDLFVDGDWHSRIVAFLRDRARNSNGDNARCAHQAPALAPGLREAHSLGLTSLRRVALSSVN